MALEIIHLASRMSASNADVWAWHERPGALERLLPPWEDVETVRRDTGLAEGNRTTVRVGRPPLAVSWTSEHLAPDPPRSFADFQVEGPFARWHHRHLFLPVDGGGCDVEDRIEYELPLEPVSGFAAGGRIRHRIERGIAYRHRVLARDFKRHGETPLVPGQTVAISGASGMLGSVLACVLSTGGHEPVALVRSRSTPPIATRRTVEWDIGAGTVDERGLSGCDAVVHLAGESIAGGRWTADRRRRILDSRVEGTRLLASALARLDAPPRVLVCASAIGYYGDRGDALLDESSSPGTGFLADVVEAWEDAAAEAREAGIRVVHLRFGIILWPSGGALPRLLTPTRAGVGGRLGDGEQTWSWVSLDDAVGAILHSIAGESLRGPVNVASPNPVSNAEFTDTLARVVNRPALLPAPAFGLRLLLGEDMADELLLASARVDPAALRASGYRFADPVLEPALRHLLGRYPSS